MRKLIPNRNKVFENEKIFLAEKYRQGFKLKKKGVFFYQFIPVHPKDVAYEIDLVPRSIADDELHITGWETIETNPIFYKKLNKIYYLSTDPENRLLIDEGMQLNYYKRAYFLWNCICIIPFFLILTLLFAVEQAPLASTFLADVTPYLFFFAILLLIFSTRTFLPFNQGIQSLREKLGEETDFPVFYLITFTNPTPDQKKELDEKISAIGYVVSHTHQKGQAYYLLESLIHHIPELKQELMNITTIQASNIKITRHAGAYSMPLIISGWDSEE